MKFANMLAASVVAPSVVLMSAPSFAASAHNIQFGPHTANADDTLVTEALKQQR